MRLRVAIPFLLTITLAACGGAAAPSAPTAAPGQPTPAATAPPVGGPTAVPPAGGTTASVVIAGGATPGEFSGTADPGCAVGFMGAGIWSVNYAILQGSTAGMLSELVLIYDPTNGGMKMTVGVGPIYDTAHGFAEYPVTSNYAGHSDDGTGTVTLNDAGQTATLHATAATAAGVVIDATVNCPSITRG